MAPGPEIGGAFIITWSTNYPTKSPPKLHSLVPHESSKARCSEVGTKLEAAPGSLVVST